MRTFLCLFFLPLFSGCTIWQMATMTNDIIDVVQELPQDSAIEEMIEEHLEEHFEMEKGSIDLSPFSEEGEDWVKLKEDWH